jgi:LPS-assembly protein
MFPLVLWLLIGIRLLAPAVAPAQDVDELLKSIGEDDALLPWTIDADTMRYDETVEEYVAEGDVLIRKGGRTLRADYVRFNARTMSVIAHGNVRVTSERDVLTGSRVELNLENRTGTIYDGDLFISESNFRMQGAEIRKLGETQYEIREASMTTCDGDPPDWRITGQHIRVTVEGYGIVRNATFRVRRLPVVFTPFLVFPAKIKRQSGLLWPEFGTSDRWGLFWNQPLYWAINANSDATLFYNPMTERGHKIAAEYRYYRTETSYGAWIYDYLKDRKIDDGTGDNSQRWGYPDDDALRTNEDRYWFRGNHYENLPHGVQGRLEVDLVSDQDYLNEFKSGYTGFNYTDEYFQEAFSRQIEDFTDPERLSRLNLRKNWTTASIDVDFRWTEDAVEKAADEPDDALQRLPLVLFDVLKQPLAGSPFYGDLASSYNYFYRRDGDSGHRVDLLPRVYLPLRWGSYLSVEPSVGYRQTLWYLDPDPAFGTTDDDDYFDRGIFDARLELTTDLFRVYDWGGKEIDRIKHTLQPQITYEYVDEVDQDDLPRFDALDRIDNRSLITYGFTNFFTYRRVVADDDAPADSPPSYRYHQFCRLKFSQGYDIDEANRNDLAPGEKRRPFLPIVGELDVRLAPFLTVDADAGWNVYDDRFDFGNIAARITDKRRDSLFVEYRFARDDIESIYSDLQIELVRGLAAGIEYERNIFSGETLLTAVRGIFRSQCWGVEVRFVDEPNDDKIEFAVSLTGLGEVGTSY